MDEEIECYWFFEGQQDDESSVIKAICLDCHNLSQWKTIGWHYKGLSGNWEIKCASCGKNIKQPIKENNN